MNKFKFLFTFLAFSFIALNAQKAEIVKGELLVQVANNDESLMQNMLKDLAQINGQLTDLKITKRVAPNLSIWLIKFNADKFAHEEMLKHVRLHKNVLVAQNNHKIEFRSTNTPNDSQFNNQWQYINPGGSGGVLGADMDADSAWAITTGGLTSSGNEIVVCIIDDGIDENHPDWGDNIWVNENEVANGVDTDGNGFIDDVKGWNAYDNNDNVSGGGGFFDGWHGSPVAGIVGAKGNNGIGVAGVNWDVKLMIVVGGGDESDAIAAYAYPLAMRKLYNQTNGEKGAFVVATNASWGVDYARASEAPLWCSMYDSLGKYGILNAGATINGNENVDLVGDLPTECPSDYLVSVTNLGRNDFKITEAGFGATTIDLGAYGEDAYTMAKTYVDFMGDTIRYEGFGGTSGATPHVAGAIALLYSAECQSFNDLYQNYPDSAALKIKKYILDGGEDNASLQGITVTGKKLNLHGALKKMLEDCNNCPSIASTIVTNITDNSAQIALGIEGQGDVTGFTLDYRVVGETIWQKAISSINIIQLVNLNPQTLYEYRVKTECEDFSGKTSDIEFFSTVGVSVSNIASENGILIYPNPSNDFIKIKDLNTYNIFDVSINDYSGKLIFKELSVSNDSKLNIGNLSEGIYMLKLVTKNNEAYFHKLIKY